MPEIINPYRIEGAEHEEKQFVVTRFDQRTHALMIDVIPATEPRFAVEKFIEKTGQSLKSYHEETFSVDTRYVYGAKELGKEMTEDERKEFHLMNDKIQNLSNEIDRLAEYLLQNHSEEIGQGNLFEGESAVDVAIRLLDEK